MSSSLQRVEAFVTTACLCVALCGWLALDGCRHSAATPTPAPPPLPPPSDAGLPCTTDVSLSLYQRKIEPILNDEQPVVCNQCHLPGIDLGLFVRATPCQTMACLQQLGLVDMTQPANSTVLTWIGRSKPESSLITAEVIQQEHEAFLDWIQYSAHCGAQVCPTYDDACQQTSNTTACDVTAMLDGGAVNPDDCSELGLEQLFTADVYHWRERCYPCHFTSDTGVPEAPKWITDLTSAATTKSTACASSSLETMHTVLKLGLVDLQTPEQSLLLLKPLDLPGGPVTHGGGQKFDDLNDPSYIMFRDWISHYAACSAQDPSLLTASPPPPTAAAMPADAGPVTSIYGYCNCVLFNCHDQSHQKWGETDEELLAGCRAEALNVPAHGSPVSSGNFIECRATFCEQSLEDSQFCGAALGETICQ